MHRVVSKFRARGVVADKVRDLQHVARILVGAAAASANQRARGRRVGTLPGGGRVLNALHYRARCGALHPAPTVGKEVRAQRGAVQGRAHRGAGSGPWRSAGGAHGPGRQRHRLLLIARRAHGDHFHIARLCPRAVNLRHRQAAARGGRYRATAVRRGPGDGAVGLIAQETRVHVMRRQHHDKVQGIQGVRGAAEAQLDHLRALRGVDDMQARDPLAPHRVIGHQGQIAALVGGHGHRPGPRLNAFGAEYQIALVQAEA